MVPEELQAMHDEIKTLKAERDNAREAEHDAAREVIKVRQENTRLREALERIAHHAHCSYEGSGAGDYGVGVTDGHRCAAMVARAALTQKEE